MTEVSQLPSDSRVPAHPPGFLTPPRTRLDVFRRHRCWASSVPPPSPQGQAGISQGCSPSAEVTSVTQKGCCGRAGGQGRKSSQDHTETPADWLFCLKLAD